MSQVPLTLVQLALSGVPLPGAAQPFGAPFGVLKLSPTSEVVSGAVFGPSDGPAPPFTTGHPSAVQSTGSINIWRKVMLPVPAGRPLTQPFALSTPWYTIQSRPDR